jgi:hypothetical protein
MPSEFLDLACTPLAEPCVSVSSSTCYLPAMRKELKRFKEMLEKIFPIPKGFNCHFFIHWQNHEFGRYGEVAILFEDEIAADFAYFVESNLPETWNDTKVLTYTGGNNGNDNE